MSDSFENSDPLLRLTETDQALLRRAWTEGPAVWRFVPKRGSDKHVRKWLVKQGPAEWHDIALHFDWDSKDLTPLHVIASQPDADRASIMSMVLDADILALEKERQSNRKFKPHRTTPQVAELLDIIYAGFDAGHYEVDRFKMGHAQSLLSRTKADLDALPSELIWPLPDRAWARPQSQNHAPEYVWDRFESCQRLPFDVWVRTKLRPN